MKSLLKDLQEEKITPKSEKGVFQLIDWSLIDEMLEKSVAKSKKEIEGKTDMIFRDTQRTKLEMQGHKLEIQKSIESFTNQISGLKTAINSVHSFTKKDIFDINKNLNLISKKISEMSSKDDYSKNDKRMQELEDTISGLLNKTIIPLKESVQNIRKESGGNLIRHSQKYESDIVHIYKRFKTLEEIMGKIPKDIYEFGSQLYVNSGGKLVGITSLINFVSGFTVVPNGLGIDITATSSGGGSGGFGLEDLSSQVSPGNRVFIAKNTPSFVILNQQTYFQNYGYTLSEKTITFDASITPVLGSTVMSVYANQSSSGSGSLYNDTVSGVIDGVNKIFTVPNIIGSAINLVLANSSYQFGVDYTFSNNTITMTVAPDLSLANKPFWFAYSSSTAILTETVSGTINGSNITFTVPTTIINAIQLVLGNSLYQYGIDYSFSGNTITMTTAPDLSLRNQSFWLVHT